MLLHGWIGQILQKGFAAVILYVILYIWHNAAPQAKIVSRDIDKIIQH